MGTQGLFGYILGKKTRTMHVQYDADMLWDILIREIYVIMKHFGTIEKVRDAFGKIQSAKNNPSSLQIEKCKYFTDLNVSTHSTTDWYCLLRGCQSSFINILECGYILNQTYMSGYIFIWNLNTNTVEYTFHSNNKEKDINMIKSVSVPNNIMVSEDVPILTYNEIVDNLKNKYDNDNKEKYALNDKIKELENDISKIKAFLTVKFSTDISAIAKSVNILLELKEHDLQISQFNLQNKSLSSKSFSNRLNDLGMIKNS